MYMVMKKLCTCILMNKNIIFFVDITITSDSIRFLKQCILLLINLCVCSYLFNMYEINRVEGAGGGARMRGGGDGGGWW